MRPVDTVLIVAVVLLLYLGVAAVLYVVLRETVGSDDSAADEANYARVSLLWPVVFVIGTYRLLFDPKDPS